MLPGLEYIGWVSIHRVDIIIMNFLTLSLAGVPGCQRSQHCIGCPSEIFPSSVFFCYGLLVAHFDNFATCYLSVTFTST